MKVILSLGSNLGDRAANIRNALVELSRIDGTKVTAKAKIYETEPVDVPKEFSDALYLNSAAILETSLSADEISVAVHEIEARLGRKRSGYHAPRTIDIDIIAYGSETRNTPELKLPHPEAASRRFVLTPLCDICPDVILPGQTRTAAELLAALPPDGQRVVAFEAL